MIFFEENVNLNYFGCATLTRAKRALLDLPSRKSFLTKKFYLADTTQFALDAKSPSARPLAVM
jgi:hypothetical protein